MKTHRLTLLTFGLLAVLLISACVPAITASPAPTVSVPTATLAATSLPAQLEATLVPTEAALPVATSRGPSLEATNPSTVSLAAGQLQLVEFFRFT